VGPSIKTSKKFFVYMVQCANGAYYTGYTDDVEKRVNTHNSGKGAKYTRAHRPVKLVFKIPHDTKSEAMKQEAKIKKMSRKQKEFMVYAHELLDII
jgi:putative endonuclease